jgi:hypothetical protein
MPKTTYILAVMLCSILSYGQQITFHENVNYRASKLQQSLDSTGNYLLLESKDQPISQIDIYNDDFSQSIHIQNKKTKISLKSLPAGNFVIQAKIDKQFIIMYVEKNEDTQIASSEQNIEEKAVNDTSLQLKSIPTKEKKSPLYYWVVYESNSNFGSSSSMRLEYKDDIAKLILKNKLELKSNIGKANKLIIYEVYNKSEFMNKQFRNPKYYKSADASKFLNAEPLYASNSEIEDDF